MFTVRDVAKDARLTLPEAEIKDAAWMSPSEALRHAGVPVRRRLEAITAADGACAYLEDGSVLPAEK